MGSGFCPAYGVHASGYQDQATMPTHAQAAPMMPPGGTMPTSDGPMTHGPMAPCAPPHETMTPGAAPLGPTAPGAAPHGHMATPAGAMPHGPMMNPAANP